MKLGDRDLTGDEVVFFSLVGIIRFDAPAVAEAIRNDSLSDLGKIALANLIEGNHPGGLRLKMTGQGKDWEYGSLIKKSEMYRRCIALGERFEEIRPTHETWIETVEELSAEFGLGDSTVAQQLALYPYLQDLEK